MKNEKNDINDMNDMNSMKKPKKPVRTRFAPSPTGQLHIGGARTALFNYLYARALGGKLILRIEDTDRQRSSASSEREALQSLQWLGVHEDEGPTKGGPFGPYRQSERLEIYRSCTERLLQAGAAYPCFCSDEELSKKQGEAKIMGKPYIYDGSCRSLSPQEIEGRKNRGERYAIRFRATPQEIIVSDLIQGRVRFDSRLIGDFIIVKSDGFPSYNYAVVIDDHAMQISHVIRGVGHLSNTPRQILISQALGFELPQYAHIAEIVGNDRKKLSKRQGAFPILLFRDLGYLPEACLNYMALLGWYPRDGVEFMPQKGGEGDKGELEKKFDIKRCSKSPAMFDFFLAEADQKRAAQPATIPLHELERHINKKSKLNWLNNLHLRHLCHLSLEELWKRAQPWIAKEEALQPFLRREPEKIKRALESILPYITSLRELPLFLKEIFRQETASNLQEAAAPLTSLLADDAALQTARTFMQLIQKEQPAKPEEFSALMELTGQTVQKRGRDLFMPIRIAATGARQGLELPLLFSILGWEEVAERIETALAA